MDGFMLDLGSEVNNLLKKSWELMGKPNLVWSPILLWSEKWYRIYPIGQMDKVGVNIEGVKSNFDRKFIYIMDSFDPYPALRGIDWAFENNVVLNLKKRKMSIEIDTLHVITPLNPNEGDKYNDPLYEDVQSSIIENICKITRHREEYINPTAN